MNKTELIAEVTKQANLPKSAVEKVLNTSLAVITKAIQEKESISIMGFGTLEVKSRKAREGYSPAKKEKIQIPAKNYVCFNAGKQLKDAANQASE